MKRKSTDSSFGSVLFTMIVLTMSLSLAVSLLVAIVKGTADFSAINGVQLFNVLAGYAVMASFVVSLCLRWREGRRRDRAAGAASQERRGRLRKFLPGFMTFCLIAAVPITGVIKLKADNLETWLMLFALYLLLVTVFILFPCSLIYGLGKSLAEKEAEQEELDEAKKY